MKQNFHSENYEIAFIYLSFFARKLSVCIWRCSNCKNCCVFVWGSQHIFTNFEKKKNKCKQIIMNEFDVNFEWMPMTKYAMANSKTSSHTQNTEWENNFSCDLFKFNGTTSDSDFDDDDDNGNNSVQFNAQTKCCEREIAFVGQRQTYRKNK